MKQAEALTAQERKELAKMLFELHYPNSADQRWAMQQLERFQFSHHIDKEDCLIASVAYRLQVPLYTHNLKDMVPILGTLAVKAYA